MRMCVYVVCACVRVRLYERLYRAHNLSLMGKKRDGRWEVWRDWGGGGGGAVQMDVTSHHGQAGHEQQSTKSFE